MFYVVKFFSILLLPPGLFFIALAGLSLWMYRRGQRGAMILGVITILFYSLSTGYIADRMVRQLEDQYMPPAAVQGDVVVMLGGGATGDTPDIEGEGNLSGHAANRLLTAARLQKRLAVPIIVSGGKVFESSGAEAFISRRILLGLGVPDHEIIPEDASLNTRQNARNVASILRAKGYSRPILVTSAFHMRRSVFYFAKEGIAVQPFPSDYLVNREDRFSVFQLLPSADSLEGSCLVIREMVGLLAARVGY